MNFANSANFVNFANFATFANFANFATFVNFSNLASFEFREFGEFVEFCEFCEFGEFGEFREYCCAPPFTDKPKGEIHQQSQNQEWKDWYWPSPSDSRCIFQDLRRCCHFAFSRQIRDFCFRRSGPCRLLPAAVYPECHVRSCKVHKSQNSQGYLDGLDVYALSWLILLLR